MSDPILATPPAACCLQGFVHTGQPTGDIIHLAGMDTYRARPPNPADENRIIFYFPDVWGIEGSFLSNGKLLMDYFALQGLLPPDREKWSGTASKQVS